MGTGRGGGGTPTAGDGECDSESEEVLKGEAHELEKVDVEGKDEDGAESGDPDDVKPRHDPKLRFEQEDVTGRWGVLPPTYEELLQQYRDKGVPAKYVRLLEQYYRKANKESSTGD